MGIRTVKLKFYLEQYFVAHFVPPWVHKSRCKRERVQEGEREREKKSKETPTFGCWGLSCVHL